MASKDHCKYSKAKQDLALNNSNDLYSNFTLNKSHKCTTPAFNQKRSKSIQIEKVQITSKASGAIGKVDSQKDSSISLKKSQKNLSKDYFDTELTDAKNQSKAGNFPISNKSSSTLSLHIAAYENFVEAQASNSFADKELQKKGPTITASKNFELQSADSFFNDPLEFPRQQEDDPATPEVQQFSASQRLFTPNQEPAMPPIVLQQDVAQIREHDMQRNMLTAESPNKRQYSSSLTDVDREENVQREPPRQRPRRESLNKRQFSSSLMDVDQAEDEQQQPPRRRQKHENDENYFNGHANADAVVDDEDLEVGDENMPDLPSTSVSHHLRRSRRSAEVAELSRTIDSIELEDVVIAGQVKEVELENFMCHSNLKMRFDTDKFNCFYIVGPNGSGKSAIFAGLNIGLGGKGRANNRGNTISSYIKEGEASAKIRVHLSNKGANRLPQYDDEIIIERIIRQASSTYSLKSMDAHGKIRTVSTAKKDLDNILKRFSIELENPLCWLSQDRAREFLQEMKPNKLYEIFMITSELCIVNAFHTTTAEHLQDMQKILDNWREKQKEMKEKFEKLKRIAEATGKIKALERELSKYNWIALWIPMKNNVRKVEAIDKHVEGLKKDIEKCQKKIEGRDVEAVELRNSMETMQQRCDEIAKNISTNRGEIQKWKRVQSDDASKSTHIANRVATVRSKIKSHEYEILQANKTLESVLGRADRDILGEKAALQQKVFDAENELKQLKEQKNDIDTKKLTVESERREMFENLQECDANIRNFRNEITKIEREQRERARVAQDQMARFGHDTTDILKFLDQYASKFKKRPIGPVGMYVKLHDKKWENGVEFLMKNNLSHYLCDNAEDRRVFDNMLKHHKIKQVPVATVKFADHKYDTASAEPDRHILTVAREAIIDEPTVYNYLVDVLHIESVMLIEKDDEGRQIMSQNPPRNISKAITQQTAEIYPVKHDRPYRFYAGRGFYARVLGDIRNIQEDVSSDDNKRYAEEQIRLAERQKEEFRQEEVKIREKGGALSKEAQTIAIDCNKLERNISNYESEIRKLDSIASRETLINSAKSTLDELNNIKKRDEEVLQTVLREQAENQALYEDKGKKIQEILDQNKALAEELRTVETEAEKLRTEFENFDGATDKFRSTIRNNERQIAKQNENRERLIKEREGIEANLGNTSKYEKPENMTDPPDFDGLIDKETCDKKMLKKKSEIAALNRLNEGQHVTESELAAAKQAYDKATESEKTSSHQLKKVHKSFLAREELFLKVKEEIPIKLREKFVELMAMRNYVGDLTVDHEQKKIEISVQTHKDAKKGRLNAEEPEVSEDEDAAGRRLSVAAAAKKRLQNVTQDLKGLSGGERSYTTACFVMALWSCVESPFRCLDEFDVFMDMVNRRIIMELLSDLARKHRHIQFFFFTPQGISELQANDVEVFTMAPARR